MPTNAVPRRRKADPAPSAELPAPEAPADVATGPGPALWVVNATTGNHAVYWRGQQGRLEHVAIAAGSVGAVPDEPNIRKHLERYMPRFRDRKSTPLGWSDCEVSL